MKDLVAKLRIEAEAVGNDKIAAMARELEALAAQGGEAAPAFAALANELRALQAQQGAIDAFRALKLSVAETEKELRGLSDQVDGLAGQMDAASAATRSAADAQAAASAKLADAKSSHDALRQSVQAATSELAELRASTSSSGAQAADYARQLAEAESSLASMAAEADAAASAMRELGAGHDALAGQMDTSAMAASGASEATRAAADEQAAAAAHYEQLRDAVQAAEAALAELRTAASASGNDAADYARQLAEAQTQLATMKAEAKGAAGSVRELGAEHKASVAATRDAERAEQALAAEYERTVREAGKVSAALGEKNRALDQTRAKLNESGVGTRSLSAENQRLAAAVDAVDQRMRAMRSATSSGADALAEMGASAASARAGVNELAEGATAAADAVDQLSGAQPQLEGLAQAIAAIFAVAQLKQAAGSAIELADAFGQMDARVRMATRGNAEYERVQARLLETANATFRPLAEQQELYIRTADALRSVGLSTEQAVDVTDAFSFLLTTNAASADRAKSAIDAYSKSLASGKVDVDAWMSITTAMPTVVDAIATSMGKSTEEVRKLGVDGALSLAAINTALLQTRDASEQTAATMDATLNDAVQRLQNNWGRYLADLNASYGVTEKLVGGLVTLSENLEAVGKAAAATGFVVLIAAITAAEIKMYGYIVALKAYIGTAAGAAAATTALTVALGNLAAGTWVWAIYKNSEALEEYRERAAAAELATLNLALNQGRLKDRFEDISRSTGVAVTNMAELNAAVEEGRLHFDDATASWRAGATSMSAVAEATQHLGAGAQALVEDYYKLREAGKSTADALKGAFKGIANPEDFRGIQSMGEALAELGKTGEVSARQVDDAWRTALANLSGGDLAKFATTASQVFGASATEAAALTGALKATAEQLGKMSGTELQQFGTVVRKAFEDGLLEAEAFAKINDQVLSASFDRLGVNAAQAMGTISDSAADAIASFDNIDAALQNTAATAGQVATALELAFSQSIASADSLEALAQLEQRLTALAEGGRLGAEGIARINAELDKQRGKIEDQLPGIQSLEEAYRNLGIKTQDELRRAADVARQSFEFIKNSGKASAADLKASFTEYAERAIAANGGVVDALLQQQAGQVGLRVEADKTGKVIVQTFGEVATAAVKVEEAAKKAAGGVNELGAAAKGLGDAWDASGNLIADAGEKIESGAQIIGRVSDSEIRRLARAWQEHGRYVSQMLQAHNARIAAAEAEGHALERLARQQERINSSAARGVDDLKLRLLELNGTEEEIARARHERDEANVRRQIALLEIEIKRAAARGDETNTLREEIKLLNEQLKLLDQVYKAEQRNAKNPDRPRGSGGNGGMSTGGAPAATPPVATAPAPAGPGGNAPVVNITLQPGANLSDRGQVEQLARAIMPAIQNLQRRGL